jgi:hypothetical protein
MPERKAVDENPTVHGGASTIPPVPYYPKLKLALKSVTASILLMYLETHYPAPPAVPGRLSSPPVTIDLDQVAQDLQLSRRTLRLCLSQIGVWMRSEEQRFRAHRAGREFIQPEHTRYGTRKPYSIVGRNADTPGIRLQLRRYRPCIDFMLKSAGVNLPDYDLPVSTGPDPRTIIATVAPSALPSNARIAELLERASVLGGDRRTRYQRLRAAIANGLESPQVLRMKRPKGREPVEGPDAS